MNWDISWGPNMINLVIATSKVSWAEMPTNGLLVAEEIFERITLLSSIDGVCLLLLLHVGVLVTEINVDIIHANLVL